MNQRLRLSDTVMASLTSSGVVGRWMLAGAVFGLSGCGTGEAPSETEEVAETTEQAVTAMPTDGSCGFKVTSKYFNRRHGNGYIGDAETLASYFGNGNVISGGLSTNSVKDHIPVE